MQFLKNLCNKLMPKAYSLANENNILGILDQDFILSKKENIICGIEIRGVDYIHQTQDQIVGAFADRVNALNKLTDGVIFKILIKRRKIKVQKEYQNIGNNYASKIIELWEKNKDAYVNQYFLLIESKPSIKGILEKKKNDLTTSNTNKNEQKPNLTFLDKRKSLLLIRDRMLQTLSSFNPRALSSLETLELFSGYINGIDTKLKLKEGFLSDSYIASRVEFNKDFYIQDFNGKEIFRRIISLKEYDTEVVDSLVISKILHKTSELDVLIYIEPVNKETALRRLNAKTKITNRLAREKIFELMEQVKAEYVVLQYLSLHIIPISHSKEALDDLSENINTDMLNYGFIPINETINLTSQFFSFFPDNGFLNVRKRLQTSVNAGSMVLFEKEETGFGSNSWGNQPLTVFKTQSNNNYLFNFQTKPHKEGDDYALGHTMIVGGTGSGKTTLMSFLMMNCLKYDIDILNLDRLNGMAVVTEFLDGEYNAGENFYINPFSLEDSSENQAFLANWIRMLTGIKEDDINDVANNKRIIDGIKSVYSVLGKQGLEFGLKDFLDALEHNDDGVLKNQLERYLTNPIFDKLKDSLEFDKRITTINMDFIVNSPKDASLIAYYLFHKLVYRGKTTGRGWFMFIDEFRSYTDNEVMNDKINLALTQARKVGGVLAIALQDFNQLNEVKNARSYVQNMGTFIIFPQPSVDFELLKSEYGLNFTDVEKSFILNTRPHERKVLVKNQIELTSSIINVDLSSLGKYLSIFSSNSDKVLKMKNLQNNFGGLWKEEYLNG